MSFFRRNLLQVSVIVLVFVPVRSFADAPLFDALVLAIQHFDPEHEIGIKYPGREVEFMRDALWVARNAVPEVASFHLPVDRSVEERYGPAMFRSLRVGRVDFQTGGEVGSQLRAIAESVGLECRYENHLKTRRPNRNKLSTYETILWDLDSTCVNENIERMCTNTDIVEWLCSRGVRSLVLRTRSFGKSMRTDLHLTFRSLVDLEYSAKRLMADPLYYEVFGEFVLSPFGGNLIGDGPDIRVVADSGLVGFEGVRLEFSTGWGDCPSGCIARHYWVVDVHSEGTIDGKPVLVGNLIDEYGDEISESARERLRNPPVAR